MIASSIFWMSLLVVVVIAPKLERIATALEKLVEREEKK